MTTAGHRRAHWRPLVTAMVVLAVASAAVVTWALLSPDSESGKPFAIHSPTFEPVTVAAPPDTPTPAVCARSASAPFSPTSISIPRVVKDGKVLALARDGNNVPSAPPTSAKFTFAWDRPPGIKPGSDRGNVLLNAHTWPDGSAVGNVMLSKLDEGGRIILRGGGSELCYTVTKRVEVLASEGYSPYYDREGRPQIALIVCSGKRLGPGEWTHRTIWFAEPST